MYKFNIDITVDPVDKKMKYMIKHYNTNSELNAKWDLIECLSIIRHEQLSKLENLRKSKVLPNIKI